MGVWGKMGVRVVRKLPHMHVRTEFVLPLQTPRNPIDADA